jgi:hypothetical protein
MKKKILLSFILSLFIVMAAGAQVRLDVNVSVPLYVGAVTDYGEVGEYTEYAFLIPDLMVHYQIEMEMIKVGFGMRMVTLIVETMLFPNAFVELNVGPIAANFSLGGGMYIFFGLYSDIQFTSTILPDVSAYFKITDWFQLGAGILFVMDFEYMEDAFLYIPYARARCSFSF